MIKMIHNLISRMKEGTSMFPGQ